MHSTSFAHILRGFLICSWLIYDFGDIFNSVSTLFNSSYLNAYATFCMAYLWYVYSILCYPNTSLFPSFSYPLTFNKYQYGLSVSLCQIWFCSLVNWKIYTFESLIRYTRSSWSVCTKLECWLLKSEGFIWVEGRGHRLRSYLIQIGNSTRCPKSSFLLV